MYTLLFFRNSSLFSSPLFITLISDMIESSVAVMKLTAFAQQSHWLVQKYMNIDNVIAFCRSHEWNEEFAFQTPPTPHFYSPPSSPTYALLTLYRSRILFIGEKTKAYEIIFVLDVLRKLMRFLRKKVTVLILSLLYYSNYGIVSNSKIPCSFSCL